MSDPYLSNGKWYIPKDPDDIRYYYADITKDLSDSNTTALSVEAIVAGVTVVTAPVIIGTTLKIKLSGLDVSASPVNFCTFRVTCANTEQFDRTIFFVREDH